MQRKSLKWLKADFIYWWNMKRNMRDNIAMLMILAYLLLCLFVFFQIK